ncbi:queuosine 5'-phosphate N-glycosylase/hydrolase [Drosophila tropicalis]|uniref:queuosine 5'-phosphate N-glycosylase/hydrolase n=1 Tax=Drosophila tropicalis TaxID=46794 RepID=UPI0035ABCB54
MSTEITYLSPRESGEYIVKNAKYLRVLPEGIKKLGEEILAAIQDKKLDVTNFSQHELHPQPGKDANEDPKYAEAADWIFVVDTLNFCFWTPDNYTKYKVNGYTGYFALCAAIKRAVDEGIDIISPKYYSQVDAKTLNHIFRSDDGETKIPLFQQRLDSLHEVGKVLLDKYEGRFENVIKAAKSSAVSLLQLVVQEFPCFRDQAEYAGKHVSILKRAQILVGDIWCGYKGEGLGFFNDIDKITMFADYRVPQVLVYFKSLEYSKELLEVLNKDTILQNGDPREVEIRGASIYIIEQVKDRVLELLHKDQHSSVNSVLIDQYLWDYRRKHQEKMADIPFHKVLSIYY